MQFNETNPRNFSLDSIPCPSLARHLSELMTDYDEQIQTKFMISEQPELYSVLLITNNDYEQYQDINLFFADLSEQKYDEYRHYRFSKMEVQLLSSFLSKNALK